MKNVLIKYCILLFAIVLSACMAPVKNNITFTGKDVEEVVMTITGDSIKCFNLTLSEEGKNSFVEKWNSASAFTTPVIFIPHFSIKVKLKNGINYNLRARGRYIKEKTDWCVDINDETFLDSLYAKEYLIFEESYRLREK